MLLKIRTKFAKSFFTRRHPTQMQMRKYVYRTTDSDLCFDLSDLISALGVTDIYSRQYTCEKIFAWGFVTIAVFKTCIKTLCPNRSPVKKWGTFKAGTVFSGLCAQTQCLPCTPLFHRQTGWAEFFFCRFW